MSANANKEFAIETALAEVAERWATIDVDIVEYKGEYFKIRSTEDLFQVLEDDSVALSTMKASKFYHAFKPRIDTWEHNLSHTSEVLEVILTVQRQWMYLESIFMSSEDIRKQLPQEAVLFDQVNATYGEITAAIVGQPNAIDASQKEGVLEELNSMDDKLARIQKSLDAYLETKRQYFPRFYFLSNEDLLEILGQQKDPEQVQKHIVKCFVGVKYMQLLAPGIAGNRSRCGNITIRGHGRIRTITRQSGPHSRSIITTAPSDCVSIGLLILFGFAVLDVFVWRESPIKNFWESVVL